MPDLTIADRLLDLAQNAALIMGGGAAMKAADVFFKWRKSQFQAKRLATSQALAERRDDREAYASALGTFTRQSEAQQAEVLTLRKETSDLKVQNQALFNEHSACRRSLAEFDVRLIQKEGEVSDLRARMERQEQHLRNALVQLRDRYGIESTDLPEITPPRTPQNGQTQPIPVQAAPEKPEG